MVKRNWFSKTNRFKDANIESTHSLRQLDKNIGILTKFSYLQDAICTNLEHLIMITGVIGIGIAY